MRKELLLCGATMAATIIAAPEPARAQDGGVTLEVYGGAVDFGRFLESRAGTPTREREVSFERAAAVGGSLGLSLWDRTSIRLQGTYVPTEIVFEDDTPDGQAVLDDDEIADVRVVTAGVEVVKYLLDPGRGWSPYGVAGVTAVRWSTDEEDLTSASPLDTNGEETLWRMGAVAGLGLELRPTDRLAVRLEASTYGLGSPFDGNDAWSTSGTTMDEPGAGRMTRATLGLAWTFGGDDDHDRRMRRGSK